MVALQSSNSEKYRLNETHLTDLLSSGLHQDSILNLGHQSVDADEAKLYTGHPLPGLLFHYCDPDGKPYRWASGRYKNRHFCRIKPDWDAVDDATRRQYAKDDEFPKYLSPRKSGNRPYFSRAQSEWPKICQKANIGIDITEGEKKSDCANAHGFPTIGLAGVTCHRDHTSRGVEATGSHWDMEEPEETPSRFLPELEELQWRFRPVGIVFDSDIVEKRPVQFALQSLAVDLKQRGALPFPVILPAEPDGSKNGLDDFIYRHGRDAYAELRKTWQGIQRGRHQLLKTDKNGNLRFFIEEPIATVKAVMVWAVLKSHLRYRTGVGWYEWTGQIWQYLHPDDFQVRLDEFCLAQGWMETGTNQLHLIERLLKTRLTTRADLWNGNRKRAFANGTYDFALQRFEPGWDREDYLTQAHHYDWLDPEEVDPDRDCPHWMQFLNESAGGDGELVKLLQAYLRWLLAPKKRDRNFPIQIILDLIGPPGTGKGTFLEVLRSLAGEANYAEVNQEMLKSPESRAALIDKLVLIASDAFGHWSRVDLLNTIASNEPVVTRRLYNQADPTTRLGAVLVRAMNAYQSVPSGAEGLNRRLHVVKFDHIPEKSDPHLVSRLQSELPFISAWVWSIGSGEMRRRISWASSVPSVAEARLERFEFNTPEFQFLREVFPEGCLNIQASDLYEKYASWAKNSGKDARSSCKFGLTLSNWKRFGVQKTFGKTAKFYTIPSPEALLEAGLLPKHASDGLVSGLRSGVGLVSGSVSGSNPCHEGVPAGSSGLIIKKTYHQQNQNTDGLQLSHTKPDEPAGNQSQQGLQPDTNPTPTRNQPDTISQNVNFAPQFLKTQRDVEGILEMLKQFSREGALTEEAMGIITTGLSPEQRHWVWENLEKCDRDRLKSLKNESKAVTQSPIQNDGAQLKLSKIDWNSFPWIPKTCWQPGADRDVIRHQKAEQLRDKLVKCSTEQEWQVLIKEWGMSAIKWVDEFLSLPQEIAERKSRVEADRESQQLTIGGEPSIIDVPTSVALWANWQGDRGRMRFADADYEKAKNWCATASVWGFTATLGRTESQYELLVRGNPKKGDPFEEFKRLAAGPLPKESESKGRGRDILSPGQEMEKHRLEGMSIAELRSDLVAAMGEGYLCTLNPKAMTRRQLNKELMAVRAWRYP